MGLFSMISAESEIDGRRETVVRMKRLHHPQSYNLYIQPSRAHQPEQCGRIMYTNIAQGKRKANIKQTASDKNRIFGENRNARKFIKFYLIEIIIIIHNLSKIIIFHSCSSCSPIRTDPTPKQTAAERKAPHDPHHSPHSIENQL